MFALRGLLVIAICRTIVAMPSAPTKSVYDQRQTGDLNVQIELSDIQVVAFLSSELLDDYTDYDYFYDYADFTVKPGVRPTTSSTTGITTEKNDILQEPLELQTSTSVVDVTSPHPSATTISKDEGIHADLSNSTASDTSLKDQETSNADPSNSVVSSTPNVVDNDKSSQPGVEEDGAATAPSTVKSVPFLRSQKRCRSGYVPNGDGRCRRASRPWLTRLLP
ncbi:hypothetical protein PUN28_003800 [Cardiocondyla obscurior]|uniref:Uncharacterized protein n=1 Tax=Cardiocondyla obscurior TaxID=286306 RepID=A0AAW2GNK6_9HYME